MTDDESSLITRRRAVASAAVAGVGGIGLLVGGSDTARAQVTMGEFSATGDEATLSRAPAAIALSAQGEWAVDVSGGIEQVQITLQAIVGDDELAADVAMNSVFDATEGAFDLTADLLDDHPDVSGAMFVPDETGATKTTAVRVAVIVSAVRDGEIAAEARAEDTADVVVTDDGVEVVVGGSAAVTVEPPA
jgi:hypothetical protein